MVGGKKSRGDDDDDSSLSGDIDKNEALEILLGGLDLGDLGPSAWENESEPDEEESTNENPIQQQIRDITELSSTSKTAASSNRPGVVEPHTTTFAPVTKDEEKIIFSQAYTCSGYCTRDGRMEAPPLQIVHAGASRGNIALATRFIPKGQTIFTERAAAAAQLHEADSISSSNNRRRRGVRACQHCFRSLEPASSCVASSMGEEQQQEKNHLAIPMAHLWPVADISCIDDMKPVQGRQGLFQDAQRRLFCNSCSTWFCNQYCLDSHEQEIGLSHCSVAEVWKELPSIDSQVQSAVILATRLFCVITKHFRETGHMYGTILDGLCGTAEDSVPLELGLENDDDDQDSSMRYSLDRFYQLLVDKFGLTASEQEDPLNLHLFRRLSSVAARNSVGIRTQSPFKSYYAALLRNAGGWGTDRHAQLISELALALGGQSQLDRGMDRQVEERVAPPVAGLFTLTARLNHSCVPNAEIQSQVFVDCHIDVVALRDIQAKEEITISYLGPVRKSSTTTRRRRELRAKYLFECCCPLCSSSSSTGLVNAEAK